MSRRSLAILKYLEKRSYTLDDLIVILSTCTKYNHVPVEDTIEKKKAEENIDKKPYIDIRIRNILADLEFPISFLGYTYSIEAIHMIYTHPNAVTLKAKSLYTKIAPKFGTSAPCVQNRIRHYIRTSFPKISSQKAEKYFGKGFVALGTSPSTFQFLTTIAQYLKVEDELS